MLRGCCTLFGVNNAGREGQQAAASRNLHGRRSALPADKCCVVWRFGGGALHFAINSAYN